jgi:amino-acid N-acetyltransferase
MSEQSEGAFVEWFRGSAPYIHAHRGRTFVLVVGGEAMKSSALRSLVHDVALLSSLGIRLVLCVGARPQIDERIALRGKKARFVGDLRVTDKVALECVKEAAGTNRVQLEALLSMALPNSPMAGARMRVVTGNFVSARPVGVIEGLDYQYTGEVRRVDAEAIRAHLDSGALVILTPIGYSITGEAFNVSTHDLAAAAAVALRADKLICLVEGKGVVDRRGRLHHELTPTEAEALLEGNSRLSRDVAMHLASAVRACRRGVRRAHLVSRRIDGGLLRELFTRDGIGTLVSEQQFEGVRPARPTDVAGILELIDPLEQQGILV